MSTGSSLNTLAALIVTAPFWGSALLKTVFFRATLDEVADLGLRPALPVAVATIAIQALGPALVILNIWPIVGIAALSVFTVAATFLGHAFWKMPGGQRVHGANGFLANIGLLGGLLAVALLNNQS